MFCFVLFSSLNTILVSGINFQEHRHDIWPDFQTSSDPTVSMWPLKPRWSMTMLYAGYDITATGSSGAPEYNIHILIMVEGGMPKAQCWSISSVQLQSKNCLIMFRRDVTHMSLTTSLLPFMISSSSESSADLTVCKYSHASLFCSDIY